MSMITCPNCEQENQADRYYCDHCGFRLVTPEPPPEEPTQDEEPSDTSSLNPFSLPAREPGETGDLDLDNIPDWLRTGEHKIPESSNKQSTDSDWLSDLEDITFNVGQGQSEADDWLDADLPDDDTPLEDPTPSGVEELRQWQDGPENLDGDDLPDWLSDADSDARDEAAAGSEPTLTTWLDDDDLEEAVSSDTTEPSLEEDIEGLTSFLGSSHVDDLSDSDETNAEKVDLGGLTGFLAELDNVTGDLESSELDDSPLDLIDPTPAAAEIEAYRRGTDELAKREASPADPDEDGDELLAELSGEWQAPEAEPTLSETELEAFSLFEEADEAESIISIDEDTEIGEDTTVEPAQEAAPADEAEPETEQDTEPTANALPVADEQTFDLEAALPPEPDREAAALTDHDALAGDQEVDLTGFTNWLEEIQEMVQDPAIEKGINQADLITDPDLEIPEADEDDQAMVNEFLEELGLDADEEAERADPDGTELPDWLAEIQPTDTGILPSLDAESEEPITPTADAVPDWLSDIAGSARAQSADLGDDWLANIAPEDSSLIEEEPAPAGEEVTERPETVAEIPSELEDEILAASEEAAAADWLSEVIAAGELTDEPDGLPVPDYPDTIVVAPPAKPDTGQLEGVPEELAGADLPEWLANARTGARDATSDRDAPPAEPSEFLSQEDISYSDMPDWLQPEQTDFDSALDAALAIQGEEMVSAMGGEWAEMLAELPNAAPDVPEEPLQLEEADIPDWLQELKPDENAPQDAPEPEEVTGVLAGVRGVIDVEPVIALPRQSQPMKLATATGSQQKQAELLRQVAIAERAQTVQVGSRRASTIPLWLRLLMAVLLVSTLLAARIEGVQSLFADFFTTPTLSPAAVFAEALLAGTNGQTVLVAVEYTPANAGEMTPIATALLDKLAAQNNQFVLMSQYPAGVPIANQLSADLTASQLGYIPGEAVGLRQLAGCLNEAACDDFANFDGNIDLIVLLTSERTSLQNWVEQVGATSETPIVAGLSGMMAPLSRPYLATKQLDGAIMGIQEAALLASDNDALRSQATGQSVATWLVVGLILLGNLVSLFSRDTKPKTTGKPVEHDPEPSEEAEAPQR